MRKLAPAFIVSAVLALATGSAIAGGNHNKSTTAASSDTSSSVTSSTSGNTMSSSTSMDATTPDGKKKMKQTARNDAKCDASKLPAGSSLPKDCLEKSGTGAAAVGSTQGQSGGSSGSSQ